MRKIAALVIAAIAFSAVLYATVTMPPRAGPNEDLMGAMASENTVKIIVVPYFDPHDMQWDTIYAVADKYPNTIKYVIINPCSGPCGATLSGDWQGVIANLKKRGIITLGYIFNTSESIENIDYYMKSPVPTDGIFFDNESSTDNLGNFKKFSDHVHDLGGIVYINPGYNFPQVAKYITSGSADVANIHEIESDKSKHIMVNSDLPPQKLSAIIGNVGSYDEMASKMAEVASKGIGVVYVYGDTYHMLPPFFIEEVRQASTIVLKH